MIQFPVSSDFDEEVFRHLNWTEAEILIAKWLSKQRIPPIEQEGRTLERIWGQLELLQGAKRLDFLVFFDDLLLVVEVKGFEKLENIPPPMNDNNPWAQCHEYKHELIEQIGGYLPVAGIVAFPYISKSTNVAKALKSNGEQIYKIGTWFAEDLKKFKIGDLIVYAKQFVGNKVSNPNMICAMYNLIPDIFVKKIENCIPELTLYALEKEQLSIAQNLDFKDDRIVYGVAGSGKTFLLLNKARQLSSIFEGFGWKILVLCYNKPLQIYLKHELSSPNIEVRTVLSWFLYVIKKWNDQQLLQELAKYENTDEFFDRLVSLVRKGIEQGFPLPTYEAILIDEGQDFDKDWYKLIRAAYKHEKLSLFAVYLDGLQAIHTRRENRFRWSEVGISARGRTKYLRKNYRNASRIAEYALKQAKAYVDSMGEGDPEKPDYILLPQNFGRLGGQVIEHSSNRKQLGSLIASILASKEIYHTAMIIYDKIPDIDQLADNIMFHLSKLKISPLQIIFSPSGSTIDAIPTDSIIPLLSVYRSKGLEADLVIFIYSNETPISLKYVAITRARETLFMVSVTT